MGTVRCMICSDTTARRAIDEELAKGMTGAGLARLMTLRGFEVSPNVVNEHNKHRTPEPPPGARLVARDAAIFVRDAQMKALQTLVDLPNPTDPDLPNLTILQKDLQPAVKSMLTAQRDLDKRVGKTNDQKTRVAVAMLLSGAHGGLSAVPEYLQIDDGRTIEGEFEEVDSVDR